MSGAMKRILFAILAVTVLFMFIACDKGEEPVQSDVIETYPIPVPSDGWTAEMFLKTIRIDQKPLPYPLTIEGLGGDIRKADIKINDSGSASAAITLENNVVLLLSYENINSYNDISSATPADVVIYSDDPDNADTQTISFNGISLGASAKETQAALGTPYYREGWWIWAYRESGTLSLCFSLMFNASDELCNVTIYFDDK